MTLTVGYLGHWYDRHTVVNDKILELMFTVNTFTEHHGGAWSHKDLQHTFLGVLCMCLPF